MGDRPSDRAGVHKGPGRGGSQGHEGRQGQGHQQGGGGGGATGGGNGKGKGIGFDNPNYEKDTSPQATRESGAPNVPPRKRKNQSSGPFVDQSKQMFENQSGGYTEENIPPEASKVDCSSVQEKIDHLKEQHTSKVKMLEEWLNTASKILEVEMHGRNVGDVENYLSLITEISDECENQRGKFQEIEELTLNILRLESELPKPVTKYYKGLQVKAVKTCGSIQEGEVLEVHQTTTVGWLYLERRDGSIDYVPETHVKLNKETTAEAKILTTELKTELYRRNEDLVKRFHTAKDSIEKRHKILKQMRRFIELEQECLKFQEAIRDKQMQSTTDGGIPEWFNKINRKAQQLMSENTDIAGRVRDILQSTEDRFQGRNVTEDGSKATSAMTSSGQFDGKDGHSQQSQVQGQAPLYPDAWGSVTVYVVHKDGAVAPKTYTVSAFDACKVQFILEREKKLIWTSSQSGLKLEISVKKSLIQCDVSGAKSIPEQVIKDAVISIFDDLIQDIGCLYLKTDLYTETALTRKPVDVVRQLKKQNNIEVYNCGTRGKCVVGSKVDIQQFWKDVGIDTDQRDIHLEDTTAHVTDVKIPVKDSQREHMARENAELRIDELKKPAAQTGVKVAVAQDKDHLAKVGAKQSHENEAANTLTDKQREARKELSAVEGDLNSESNKSKDRATPRENIEAMSPDQKGTRDHTLTRTTYQFEDGWEDLKIIVHLDDDEEQRFKPHKVGLSPYVIQFALTTKEKLTKGYFESKHIRLNIEKHEISFHPVDGKPWKIEDLKLLVVNTFKLDVFENFYEREAQAGSNEEACLLAALETCVPVEMSSGCVVVYRIAKTEDSIIVGEKAACLKVLREIGLEDIQAKSDALSKEARETVELSIKTYQFLESFEFTTYLEEKHIDVDIQPDRVEGTSENIWKYKEELRLLEEAITYSTLQFRRKECALLLFDINGNRNEKAHCHIKRVLQTKLSGEHKIHIARGSHGVVVQSQDSKTCTVAAGIIVSLIEVHDIKTSLERIRPFLQEQEANGMMKIIGTIPGGILKVVCMQEQRDALFKAIPKEEQKDINIPPLLQEYLATYGIDIINSLKQQYKIDIQVGQTVLTMRGEAESLKQCKQNLKKEILPSLSRYLPLPVAKFDVQEYKPEIDAISKKFDCCWKPKQIKTSTSKEFENSLYVATWSDPLGALNLTLLQVNPAEIELDVLVLPVNESLYPLDGSITSKAGRNFTEDRRAKLQTQKRNCKLGEIYYSSTNGKLKCRHTASVVMKESATAILKDIDIQTKISEVLDTYNKKGMLTIGISAATEETPYKPQKFVSAVVDGVKDHFRKTQNSRVQFFICCNEQQCNMMKRALKDEFKMPKCLAVRFHNEPNCKEADIAVECEIGILHEAKTDALVNPASKTLDLGSGQVSKKILQLAGKEIEKEAKRKYPNGISSEEIAVTSSHSLKRYGCKFVFHCVPPEYSKKYFRVNIKKIVRLCLYQAERKENCTSIAFPALGVGTLMYPRRDVAVAMFEAIDEYRMECIKPTLKKIKIILYQGDKATSDAFCNEDWRRGKGFPKELQQITKEDCTVLKKDPWAVRQLVDSFLDHPEVLVITQKDIVQRPTSAVEMHFTNSIRENMFSYKNASDEPISRHDKYKFGVDFGGHLWPNTAIESCLTTCETSRATEIIMHYAEGWEKPVHEQLKVMIDVASGQVKPVNLETICMVVRDENEMNSVLDYLNQGFSTAWKKVTHGQSNKDETFIQLVGQAPKVEKATEEIVETIQNIQKDLMKQTARAAPRGSDLARKENVKTDNDPTIRSVNSNVEAAEAVVLDSATGNTALYADFKKKGAIPKHFKRTDGSETEIQKVKDTAAEEDEGMVDNNEIFGEVSAVINKGIINYRNELGDVTEWLQNMGRHFKLEAYKEDGDIRMKGSLDAICNFQEYLDNTFPENPASLDSREKRTEVVHIPMHRCIFVASLKFFPFLTEKRVEISAMRYDPNRNAVRLESSDALHWKEQLLRCVEKLTIRKVACNSNDFKVMYPHLSKEWDSKNTFCGYEEQEEVAVLIGTNEEEVLTLNQQVSKFLQRQKPHAESTRSEDSNITHKKQKYPKDILQKGNNIVYKMGKLTVFAYKGNLMNAFADCIAVSTNSSLKNDYGAASVVAKAAGSKFLSECNASISNCGELKYCECRLTTSGNLGNCKAVAHVCVPFYQNASDIVLLSTAVTNCLTEVDRHRMESVALPVMGSGMNKYPLDACAKAYADALSNFAQKSKSLKEVYIVDMKIESLIVLHDEVCKISESTEDIKHNNSAIKSRSMGHSDGDLDKSTDHIARWTPGAVGWTYQSHPCKLYVSNTDITATAVDVIVCPEGDCSIANKLLHVGGDSYKQAVEKLKGYTKSLTNVFPTGSGHNSCKKVIHAVSPRWSSKYKSLSGQFADDIRTTVKNVLKSCHAESLAIPLIGSKEKRSREQTPREICCEAMIDGLQECLQYTALKRIDFCSTDNKTADIMDKVLQKRTDWKRESQV